MGKTWLEVLADLVRKIPEKASGHSHVDQLLMLEDFLSQQSLPRPYIEAFPRNDGGFKAKGIFPVEYKDLNREELSTTKYMTTSNVTFFQFQLMGPFERPEYALNETARLVLEYLTTEDFEVKKKIERLFVDLKVEEQQASSNGVKKVVPPSDPIQKEPSGSKKRKASELSQSIVVEEKPQTKKEEKKKKGKKEKKKEQEKAPQQKKKEKKRKEQSTGSEAKYKKVTPKMSCEEVYRTVSQALPALQGQLDWIKREEIDGTAFQALTLDTIKDFGVDRWGPRRNILSLQDK